MDRPLEKDCREEVDVVKSSGILKVSRPSAVRELYRAFALCVAVAIISLASSCGECVCACTDDAVCGAGAFCAAGICFTGSGSACDSDADCPESEVCLVESGFCFLDELN